MALWQRFPVPEYNLAVHMVGDIIRLLPKIYAFVAALVCRAPVFEEKRGVEREEIEQYARKGKVSLMDNFDYQQIKNTNYQLNKKRGD